MRTRREETMIAHGLKISATAAALVLGLGLSALAQGADDKAGAGIGGNAGAGLPGTPTVLSKDNNKSTDPQDQTGATTKAVGCDEQRLAGAETTAQAIADGTRRDAVMNELNTARGMMAADPNGCAMHYQNAMDMMK